MRATVVALLSVALATGAAHAQSTPNLTCFAIKDSGPRGTLNVVLPQDVGGQTCTVKTPARFACLETSGASGLPAPGEDTGDVSTSVLCYRARCTRPTPAAGQVTDALGARAVRFKAAKLVCLPANAQPGATTTTAPGATTTTTVAPAGCSFSDGECRGTCAPGQRCGSAVGTASCECRATSCGDADTPECNGACDDPDQACVFAVTGCECVP